MKYALENIPINTHLPRFRFNYHASTHDDAILYFKNRALQLAHTGIIFKSLKIIPEGVWATFILNDIEYYSLYLLKQFRGKNKFLELYNNKYDSEGIKKIITLTDCQLESYLKYKKIEYIIEDGLTQTKEYKLIEHLYSSKVATRSGVSLMNHIDEGLYILYKLNARNKAKLAYILHPIFQSDIDLVNNIALSEINNLDIKSVILAMEYRSIANAYLSKRIINSLDDIKLSPLKSVNVMLIADKIQNCKDFELYHLGTHARSAELELYFKLWLTKLNISNDEYINYKRELINLTEYKLL